MKYAQPYEHQENLKKKREEYVNKKNTREHAKKIETAHQEYADKKGTQEHKNENYTSKKVVLKEQREKYSLKKGTVEHEIKLLKKRKNYSSLKASNNSDDKRIKKFKEIMMEGPYYICVVCNRSLYKRSVTIFKIDKYESSDSNFYFSPVQSFNGNLYICLTCSRKLKSKKSQTPCQAVGNKLELYNFPQNLPDINRLEKVLISKRLLFKKVVIMPKGNSPKIKGAICNVPVDAEDVCNVLPRPACSNGLLLLKLKRKLMYRGHVYFKPILVSLS